MSRLEDIGSNVDFGLKRGQIWTKKGLKRAGPDFSWTSNIDFPQEDRKTSIYTKNQQHSMNSLEDKGSNVDFGPKRGEIGPKRAQKVRNETFPGTFTCFFHK